MYFPERLSASLMSTLSIWSGLTSFFSTRSMKLISQVLSLWYLRKVRMNDQPSSSVEVFVRETFSLLSKFKFKISWWEDMKSWWCSVLNDEGWLLCFGDYSAESGECISVGVFIIIKNTIRSSDGKFHLFLFSGEHVGHREWLSEGRGH